MTAPTVYIDTPRGAGDGPARLDDQARRGKPIGLERLVGGPHDGLRVLGRGRRVLVPGVGDGEAAAGAELLHLEPLLAEGGGERDDCLDCRCVGLQLEDGGAKVEVEAHEAKMGRSKGPAHRLRRVSRGQRKSELAVQHAGCGVRVSVRVDAGRDAEENPRGLAPGGGQTLQAVQLRQVVDHNLPHAVVEGLRQLRLRLVVAVEVDGLRGECHALGYGQLPAGHHVHAQPLFLDQSGQRRAHVGLRRVGDL